MSNAQTQHPKRNSLAPLNPPDEGEASYDAEDFSRSVADIVEIDAEKRAKLCLYRDLLLRWNSRMNLLSAGDTHRFWSRHCWESVQLLRFLPSEGCSVCDLGSGAGFPGLVLALLSEKNRFTLIESRQKKASFLRHVSRETCTKIEVETERVEDKPRYADVIVSRAFASIEKTLQYLDEWTIGKENNSPNNASQNDFCRALLLKGSRWQHELTQARQSWTIQACVEGLQLKNGQKNEQKNEIASSPKNRGERSSCIVLKLKTWSRDRTDSSSR